MRSSRKLLDTNSFNIMATIPKQGSSLDLKLMKLVESQDSEGDERGSAKHSLHKTDSQQTLGPTGRLLRHDSKMSINQNDYNDDQSPISPNHQSLMAAAARAPDMRQTG